MCFRMVPAFGEDRIAGLTDAARPGKPAHYGKTTEKRVLSLLDEKSPKGYSQWNRNRLAEVLGDVSKAQIWRMPAAQTELVHQHGCGVRSEGCGCGGPVPESARECSGAVDGRETVDSRAQWYLRLPDGKAVNACCHCYKRHGTTTLFAALEVTTGLVKAAHYPRRRRREFLDFMNEIVTGHGDAKPKRP